MSSSSPAKRARADTAGRGGADGSGAGAGAGSATTGSGDGSAKVVLHSYWRSSCSWRVRIALHLKKIDYEYNPVHLLRDGGEQLKTEFAERHPMKELPLLCIDGLELAHSTAIICYLDETRPDVSPLMPKDAPTRAKVRQIMDIIASDTQPVQNLRVLKHVMSFFEGAEEKTDQKLAWGKKWIANGFDALEQVLKKTAGTYAVGDSITMADLYIPGQVYNAGRFGVDMAAYPTIQRIDTTLGKMDEFARAHPNVQPDAPNDAA